MNYSPNSPHSASLSDWHTSLLMLYSYPQIIDAQLDFLLQNFQVQGIRDKLQDVAGRAFTGETHMVFAWKKMLSQLMFIPLPVETRKCRYDAWCRDCSQHHDYYHLHDS